MSQTPLTPISPMAPAPAGGPLGRGGNATRFTPLDPVRVLRQYIWLLVVALVVGVGLGVVAAVLAKKYTPTYASEAQLLVTGELTHVYDQSTNLVDRGQLEALKSFMRTQTIRMTSPAVLDAALSRRAVRDTAWFQRYKLGVDPETGADRFDIQRAREDLKENLNVQVLRGSTLISVKLSGGQERELPRILEEVVREFLRAYQHESEGRDLTLRQMMFKEINDSESERRLLQNEMDAFRQEHNLERLKVEGTEWDVRHKKLSEEYALLDAVLRQRRIQYEAFVNDLQNQGINQRPEQQESLDQDERIKPLKTQRDNLLLAKTRLLQKLGPNHDTVLELDREIKTTEAEMARKREEVRRERDQIMLSGMQKAIMDVNQLVDSLRPAQDEARDKVRDLDMLLRQFDEKDRQLKIVQARHDRAQQLLDDMRVRAARPDNSLITTVQQPTTAELTFPSYPAMIVGVTMLLVGLTAGLVFLKELLDQRIKSPSDLQLLPDATLLGVLPLTTDDPSGPTQVEGIVHKDPAGLMAEAFRQVRTEVLGRMDRRGYKTLMLVGAQPGCGTSTVAANLATSMTLSGRRVLLIDANLRRPAQCRLFNARTTPGLVEVLKGTATFEEAVIRNGDPRLDVLPSGDGHATPPEVLDSTAMRNLLSQFEGQYDVVLVDAPPMLVASDSRLLCKQVDAVALVVRAKAEKRGMVGRMLREIEGQRADVLGVILNGVHTSAGGYFRKNYQAFYRYRNFDANGVQRALPAATTKPVEKA